MAVLIYSQELSRHGIEERVINNIMIFGVIVEGENKDD